MFFITVLLHTTCEECLNTYESTFWCASMSKCLPLDQISSCKFVEHHDMVLNATQCCSPLLSSEQCLTTETQSFCTWCPEHFYRNELIPGHCLYKSEDSKDLTRTCHAVMDVTSPCSSYATCEQCSTDLPCAWCATTRSCVSTFSSEYYGVPDHNNCNQHLMKWDAHAQLCLCKDNKYFSKHQCHSCPGNTTSSPDGDTCLCRQFSIFNITTQQCDCVDNSFKMNGICQQCPRDSYAVDSGCKCIDSEADFDSVAGRCWPRAQFGGEKFGGNETKKEINDGNDNASKKGAVSLVLKLIIGGLVLVVVIVVVLVKRKSPKVE